MKFRIQILKFETTCENLDNKRLTYVEVLIGVDNILKTYDAGMVKEKFSFFSTIVKFRIQILGIRNNKWLTYIEVLVGVDNVLKTYDAGMVKKNFHFLWSLESRFWNTKQYKWLTYVEVLVGVDNIFQAYDAGMVHALQDTCLVQQPASQRFF